MAQVQFGIGLGLFPFGVPRPDLIFRFAERAEALGFDAIWLGDHIVMHSPILEPVTVLSAIASRTSRLALAPGVLLVPLRNPAVVAKMIGSLDYLSGGRVILGVGVGGENPKEFEVCGVPIGERGARLDESISIMRQLWSDLSASHAGRFWQFENISMDPKPVQRNGPPLWIGGRSEAALRRAARLGDGWISYLMTPERFSSSLNKIHEYALTIGRDLSCFTPAHHQFIFAGHTKADAQAKAVAYLSKNYNQPFEGLVERFCALGTPDDCVAFLRRFVDAGVKHIVLRSTCPAEELTDQMEIYAREILPRLRG